MTDFQFDENSADKAWIRACKSSGKCGARRFQTRWKGMEDPDLLTMLMAGDAVLLTCDWRMSEHHSEFIAENNPGIIMIKHSPGINRTMNTEDAAKMVHQFKILFPLWHQVNYRNSIITITDDAVEVCRKTKGEIVSEFYKEYSEVGWQDELEEHLKVNALGLR